MIIKHPPARKRSVAFFCKSPNKKKLGASDDTNKKYPPVAINIKAMSKVNVLNIDAIHKTQPKTCKLLLSQIINNYEFQLTTQQKKGKFCKRTIENGANWNEQPSH